MGPKRDNPTTELVPDWTKANYEAMEKEIGEMDWEAAFQDKSGPEQWQVFKEKLDHVIDSNVPKKIRRKGNKPLWIKRYVLRLIADYGSITPPARTVPEITNNLRLTRKCKMMLGRL